MRRQDWSTRPVRCGGVVRRAGVGEEAVLCGVVRCKMGEWILCALIVVFISVTWASYCWSAQETRVTQYVRQLPYMVFCSMFSTYVNYSICSI